jgi:RHS repeat-associated protein
VSESVSRITQIEDLDGLTTYAYDDRDQLTGAVHADTANPDETYEYDANGNRLSSHLHDANYETDSHNRLVSDGTYNYAYDAEGNWDHRNRLTRVADKDAGDQVLQTVEFTYDAFNRRISKSLTTATDDIITHFIYDGANVLLDFVDNDGPGPNAPQLAQRYLHGPAIDQILAQDDGAGNVLWMLADHLGTVRDLVDSTGAVVNHLKYDSYGNVIAETNVAVESRYLFTGREFDDEIDLYYYRARYYDAATGRFVGEDPIGFLSGQSNFYGYVANTPARLRDPFGLAGVTAYGAYLGGPELGVPFPAAHESIVLYNNDTGEIYVFSGTFGNSDPISQSLPARGPAALDVLKKNRGFRDLRKLAIDPCLTFDEAVRRLKDLAERAKNDRRPYTTAPGITSLDPNATTSDTLSADAKRLLGAPAGPFAEGGFPYYLPGTDRTYLPSAPSEATPLPFFFF